MQSGERNEMNREIYEIMEDCPVIAAVKDDSGLETCLESEIAVVFVLYGDIRTIRQITDRIRAAGKVVIVHADLIGGLASREIAVDFLKYEAGADGIISTKLPLIHRAKELGLYTVFRFFVIDSMALDNIRKQCGSCMPDFVEILPGLMPRIIAGVAASVPVPVIAGGLISEKGDVTAALEAGAVSISTTNEAVWFM